MFQSYEFYECTYFVFRVTSFRWKAYDSLNTLHVSKLWVLWNAYICIQVTSFIWKAYVSLNVLNVSKLWVYWIHIFCVQKIWIIDSDWFINLYELKPLLIENPMTNVGIAHKLRLAYPDFVRTPLSGDWQQSSFEDGDLPAYGDMIRWFYVQSYVEFMSTYV